MNRFLGGSASVFTRAYLELLILYPLLKNEKKKIGWEKLGRLCSQFHPYPLFQMNVLNSPIIDTKFCEVQVKRTQGTKKYENKSVWSQEKKWHSRIELKFESLQ